MRKANFFTNGVIKIEMVKHTIKVIKSIVNLLDSILSIKVISKTQYVRKTQETTLKRIFK
jgi:hypothetical protein